MSFKMGFKIKVKNLDLIKETKMSHSVSGRAEPEAAKLPIQKNKQTM